MANDVTTGQALNSYTGNAALAGGDASTALGYATPDLAPLQTMALQIYNTHLIDYNQRIKDRDHMEALYLDPSIYVNLDKDLADQIQPKLDRLKELSKHQLEKHAGTKEWYEFQDLYKEINILNSKGKTVQTLRDMHGRGVTDVATTRPAAGGKRAAGAAGTTGETAAMENDNANRSLTDAQDPHMAEAQQAYLDKLKTYKLGDDIPIYNKYFAVDKAHLPEGENMKPVSYKRISATNPNMVETVQSTLNNPKDLDKKAYEDRVLTPEVATTGDVLAHTLLDHDSGVHEVELLNAKAKEYGTLGIRLNVQQMMEKHAKEFGAWHKAHPTGTFEEFTNADKTGVLQAELLDIRKGHEYLKNGIHFVPTKMDDGPLTNFTISKDGKYRLSVDNDVLRALYGATQHPVGKTETVTGSELSAIPSEIALRQAQARVANANVGLIGEKGRTEKAKQGYYDAKGAKAKADTTPPLPTSIIPQIANVAVLNKAGEFIIDGKNIPGRIKTLAGFTIPVIGKPKAGGDPDEIAKYNQAVADQKAGRYTYQMRFYAPDGTDETAFYAEQQMRRPKSTPDDFARFHLEKKGTIKFIDQHGNVVGTSQDIDKETMKENMKLTKKDDTPDTSDLLPEADGSATGDY